MIFAPVVLWQLTPMQVAINPREGVAIVGIGWIAVVTAGAVPFLATGTTTSVRSIELNMPAAVAIFRREANGGVVELTEPARVSARGPR